MRLELHLDRARAVLTPLLTPREFKVFCRVALGRPAQEAAEAWCVSSTAISMAKARMRDKLGLFSDAEVVALAIHRGLVSVDESAYAPTDAEVQERLAEWDRIVGR